VKAAGPDCSTRDPAATHLATPGAGVHNQDINFPALLSRAGAPIGALTKSHGKRSGNCGILVSAAASSISGCIGISRR